MKFIAVVLVALAVSAQADDHAHTHNHYSAPAEEYSPPAETYQASYSDSYYPSTSYESNDIDMDVILPIAVFGGLGLGALAYIDTLNRQNNLCNKLREVTNIARANAASGTTASALVAETAAPNNGITAAVATAANTVINGNRDFINALALIDNLDC